MSFLSRRTSRADQRGGRAGAQHAGSEYDDYDYAPDDYQADDENWSPDEYFSPEGIKGRWAAGARPGERGGYRENGQGPQRGHAGPDGYGRDSHRQDSYQQDSYQQDDRYGPNGYADDYRSDEYGAEYGADEYATGDYGPADYGTGGYELPDGSDDDRGGRGGARKRRDRGDRAERGERRLRLGRRDKGDDIWPDDGVSDEDYWASVAADRPFTSDAPLDANPMNIVNNRRMARP